MLTRGWHPHRDAGILVPVIQTRQLAAPIRLEPGEARSLIVELSSGGWTPALLESERAVLRLAGLPEGGPPLRRPTRLARPVASEGDIFFREDGVYYVLSQGVIRTLDEEEFYAERREPNLEIGGIGDDADQLEAGLQELAAAVEAALRARLDGRRVRYMKFEWEPVAPSTSRLSNLRADEADEGGPAFEPASVAGDVVTAAHVLADPLTREILREISKAGLARQRDITARWTQRQRSDEASSSVEEARQAGLLSTEYLLECRLSGDQILRLSGRDDLDQGDRGDLVHAPCGRAFRDENLTEAYALSDLGQRLLQKSNWLTVWVTEKLVGLGIPVEAIFWNLSEAGEEVDILLEFLEEVWIFELKDRTFSAGDAYPFNYRRARYEATKAFIVTTDEVASDAKRIFDELAEQARRTARVALPMYIEGLEAVEPALRREIAQSARRFAVASLRPLTLSSGFDIPRLITQRFGP
jgi:hypothetical protein